MSLHVASIFFGGGTIVSCSQFTVFVNYWTRRTLLILARSRAIQENPKYSFYSEFNISLILKFLDFLHWRINLFGNYISSIWQFLGFQFIWIFFDFKNSLIFRISPICQFSDFWEVLTGRSLSRQVKFSDFSRPYIVQYRSTDRMSASST